MSSSDGETKSTFQPYYSSLLGGLCCVMPSQYTWQIFLQTTVRSNVIVCHKDASCCSLLDYEMPSPSLSKNVRKRDMGMQGKVGHCKD